MTAKEHNKLIGILHLIEGGLQLFVGIFAPFIFWAIFEYIARIMPPETAGQQNHIINIVIFAGMIVLPILFISALINLIAGWKMLREKGGARAWGIVASIICLPNVPMGTGIGVYGLWFLFGIEGKKMYLKEDSKNF